ncbi:MAG: hypothetical protein NTX88_04565, partial [Candidatus Atribacteria bacterium]|nr:hypothetical protein [Candidatus Atribacteria bacterium]
MVEKKTNIFRRSEMVVVFLLILFFILFSRISAGFFSQDILSVILLTGSELGVLALGVTLLIISGEMDLSVASIFVFSNFVILTCAQRGIPIFLSFCIAL